eukprot:sb/3471969/
MLGCLSLGLEYYKTSIICNRAENINISNLGGTGKKTLTHTNIHNRYYNTCQRCQSVLVKHTKIEREGNSLREIEKHVVVFVVCQSVSQVQRGTYNNISVSVCCVKEPTKTSKQPTKTRYLGHVTGYQPIRDQCFGRFLICIMCIMIKLTHTLTHTQWKSRWVKIAIKTQTIEKP